MKAKGLKFSASLLEIEYLPIVNDHAAAVFRKQGLVSLFCQVYHRKPGMSQGNVVLNVNSLVVWSPVRNGPQPVMNTFRLTERLSVEADNPAKATQNRQN